MSLVPVRNVLKLRARGRLTPPPTTITLVLENGTGLTQANTYASLEYARQYFIGRRLHSSAWTVASDETRMAALMQATRLLDQEFIWSGKPLVAEQALGWPRTGATDKYNVARTGVPREIRDATCELAFYLLAEERMLPAQGVGIKYLKVDTIEMEFAKDEAPQTFPAYIARGLNGLGDPVRGRGTIRTVTLKRT